MIPASRLGVCDDCGDHVDRGHKNTYQRVSGWAINRNAGGTSSLALQEREDVYLCRWCVELRVMDERGALARVDTHEAECSFCATTLRARSPGVFNHVSGWARQRERGTNALSLQQRSDRYACGDCIAKLRQDVSIDQGTLFGPDVA